MKLLKKLSLSLVLTTLVASALPAHADGLGIILGAVAGGALGNQVGRGNGRTAMTVAGAIAGAVVGNELTGGYAPSSQLNSGYSTQPFMWNGANNCSGQMQWVNEGYYNNNATYCRQYVVQVNDMYGRFMGTEQGYYCRSAGVWSQYDLNDPMFSRRSSSVDYELDRAREERRRIRSHSQNQDDVYMLDNNQYQNNQYQNNQYQNNGQQSRVIPARPQNGQYNQQQYNQYQNNGQQSRVIPARQQGLQ